LPAAVAALRVDIQLARLGQQLHLDSFPGLRPGQRREFLLELGQPALERAHDIEVGEREAFRRDDERDGHLHAVAALVPAVAELAFVPLGERRVAFKIRRGEIIQKHVELRVEQIAPSPREMIEQRRLVIQELSDRRSLD
jgi:hypothetical protein